MREDWMEIEFGKLCTFSQGIQVPVPEQHENPADGLIRFLRIVDFTQGDEPPRYVKRVEGVHNVNREDISMVRYGTVGFVCTNKEGAIANNLFRIIPNYDIDKKYLIHFLKSDFFKRYLNSKGATMAALSFGLIKPISIPIPPLPEQRAIVAKIEQLFSELDNGIANLKAAKDKLEIYRQAVLKKAFKGELSNSTENIEIVPFGDAIKIVSGSTPKGINDIESSGSIPFYKVSDMNHEGNEVEMRNSNLYVDEAIIKELKIKLYPKGTVIFPKRGGAILTNKKRILGQDSAFDLNLMGVIPSEDYLSKYLYYFFVHQDLGKICDGSAVPQINNKNITPLDFPKCNIEHQKKIISEIESRLSVCDNILANIEEALSTSEALRQSILKQAFEGKLLSEEELEACKQEPDWEPAEQLLERVKNEKLAKV